MYNTYENGGFRVPNIRIFCYAPKITRIKKLTDDTNISDWKTPFFSEVEQYGGNYTCMWLVNNKLAAFTKKLNPFWHDVYNAWLLLKETETNTKVHSEPLYFNEHIKINNKPFFFKDWYNCGIKYINDLLDKDGKLYSWQQFSETYNIISNPFRLLSVIHSIPRNWKTRIKEINVKQENVSDQNMQKLKNLKKTSKNFLL